MSRLSAVSAATPLLALLLFACDGGTGPEVGPPSRMLLDQGSGQTGVVGAPLDTPIQVKVTDDENHPVQGVRIAWTVDGDGVAAPATSTTDADGLASTAWTLGTTPGPQSIEASAGSLVATASATAEVGPADSLVLLAGADQVGVVGDTLPDTVVVRIVDAFDNPIVAAAVRWTVEGGSVTGEADTDSDGRARGTWTLGPQAGPQQLRVSAGAAGTAIVATASPAAPDSLRLVSGGGQSADANTILADSLVVLVRDAFGNPVPSVDITWSSTAGGGSLSPATTRTNEHGLARTAWSLGGTVGTQSVEATVGTATLRITAVAIAPCEPGMADGDGDRLPDCAETGTGVYASIRDAGTDPSNPDTDGDGIRDGDEVYGTAEGLDLPALGANPLRTTILMEYDWFVDSRCTREHPPEHTHRPTPVALTMVTGMFSNAPTPNPDGSTGIDIIHDYGQGGAFTGGNRIEDADGDLEGGISEEGEFQEYKAEHFAANRAGYFHYVILPHFYTENYASSGQATMPGFDMIISLGCGNPDMGLYYNHWLANTIAHELGHNLGLHHGGDKAMNYMPNYNSVMNYRFQLDGIDTSCDAHGDEVLDYSVGARPALDENALDEAAGVCGLAAGVPIDWDKDAQIDTGTVAVNLNDDYNATLEVLTDYNDWASLWFLSWTPGGTAGLRMERDPVVIVERPVSDFTDPKDRPVH